jgi:hypothetical protein
VPTLAEKMLELLIPEEKGDVVYPSAAAAKPDLSGADAFVDARRPGHEVAAQLDSLANSLPPSISLARPSDAQLALTTDPRRRPAPWEDRVLSRVLLRAISLSLNGPCVEPLFARLAFFDLTQSRRVSETMYFDCNDAASASLLGGLFSPDKISACRTVSIAANVINRNVVLVVEVYHVPWSDAESAVERYTKPKANLKDKERAKLEAETAEACARTGRHRQLIGVCALRLFDNNGAFLVGGGDGSEGDDSSAVSKIWKTLVHKDGRPYYYNRQTKESTWVMPPELASRTVSNVPGVEGTVGVTGGDVSLVVSRVAKNNDVLTTVRDILEGKARPIPGRCVVHVIALPTPRPNGRLNSELHPINPIGGESDPVVRELLAFSPPAYQPYPIVAFTNSLFLYPLSVNLSSVGGAMSTARNVCVSVKLLDSDAEDPSAAYGLPLWYGDSSQSTLTREVRTEVHYHAKKPVFHCEFKLRLPLLITERHHLLFTVSHVPLDNKKKSNADEPIGFAVVPLLNPDGSLLGSLGALTDEAALPSVVGDDSTTDLTSLAASPSAGRVAARTMSSADLSMSGSVTGTGVGTSGSGGGGGASGDEFEMTSTHVQLAAQLQSGYLSLLREEGTVRMLDRRAVFNFGVRRADSLMPRAAQLARLFRGYARLRATPSDVDEVQLRALLNDATNAYAPSVAEHFGALSFMLLDVIGSSSDATAHVAVRTWASLLGAVAPMQARDAFVDSFVYYSLDLPRVADSGESLEPGLASSALPERLVDALLSTLARPDDAEVMLPVLTPLFGVLLKIVVVRLHRGGQLEDEASRPQRASAALAKRLERLVGTLALHVVRASWSAPALACQVAATTACLLKDLLDVYDRGLVSTWIATFVHTLLAGRRVVATRSTGSSAAANELAALEIDEARLDLGVTRSCAAVAFAVLGTHYRFAALCVPVPVRAEMLVDATRQWRRRHALSTLGVTILDDALRREPLSLPLVSLAAVAVRAVLQRHLVSDNCLAENVSVASEARSRVASLYFPYVLCVIDHVDSLHKWPTSVQQDVLLPFVEILNHLPPTVDNGLRSHTSALRHVKLFAALRLCITAFAYVGKKKMHQLDRLRALDAQAWRALRRGNEASLRVDSRRHAVARQRNGGAAAAAATNAGDDVERMWAALCDAISDATTRAIGGGTVAARPQGRGDVGVGVGVGGDRVDAVRCAGGCARRAECRARRAPRPIRRRRRRASPPPCCVQGARGRRARVDGARHAAAGVRRAARRDCALAGARRRGARRADGAVAPECARVAARDAAARVARPLAAVCALAVLRRDRAARRSVRRRGDAARVARCDAARAGGGALSWRCARTATRWRPTLRACACSRRLRCRASPASAVRSGAPSAPTPPATRAPRTRTTLRC